MSSARPDGISALVQEVTRRQLPSPERCKAIRVEAGVTLEGAARAMGTSVASLLNWEAGRCRPQGRNARRWAELTRALEEAMRP